MPRIWQPTISDQNFPICAGLQITEIDLDVVGGGGVQFGGALPGFFAAGGQVTVIDHELLDDVAGWRGRCCRRLRFGCSSRRRGAAGF